MYRDFKLQFRADIRPKLHYTDTGYEHHQRAPPTVELTAILQLVVQQSHHQRTKICHIPTSGHVEMLGSVIATWRICCRIVVSSSVAGVRVVEFGPKQDSMSPPSAGMTCGRPSSCQASHVQARTVK